MPLVFAAITPHPPIIVPGVGSNADRERCGATIAAMEKLAGDLAAAQPETIVIISPHAPMDPELFTLNAAPELTGQLDEFGASLPRWKTATDTELLERLSRELKKQDRAAREIDSPRLDHGSVVPLSFFAASLSAAKILSLSYTLLPLSAHVRFGAILGRVIKSSPRRVALIASGDLSHCLTESAPGGFSPVAQSFDDKLVNIISRADWPALLRLDPTITEAAGECGLRSIVILSGALKDMTARTEVLSYEGPFGVGYLVANFKF